MTVNVSTLYSSCLNCKTNSNLYADKEFHEIYDEVGLELQLPNLVETFFDIKVKNDGKKYLCDDCVNLLIELYDLEEHAKEKRIRPSNLNSSKIMTAGTDNSRNENTNDTVRLSVTKAESMNTGQIGVCLRHENSQLTEAHADQSIPNNSHISLDSTNTIEYKSLNIYPLSANVALKNLNQQNETEKIDTLLYESVENVEDLANIGADDDIAGNYSGKQFLLVNANDGSQDLNESTSDSIIEVTNASEAEGIEHIEYVEDDIEDQDVEMENMGRTNSSNGSEPPEALIKQSEIKNSESDDQFSQIENETTDINSNCSNRNLCMEDNVCDEDLGETSVDNYKRISQNECKFELDLEDTYIEESENIYYEDSPLNDTTEEYINEMNTKLESEKKNPNRSEGKKNCQEIPPTVSFNSNETETQFYSLEDINTGEIIRVDQDEFSNDDYSLEEEYLIEEITCSEEYDNVDLNEYLDKVLVTKFQNLQLNWETECKLCLNKHNSFEELLSHSCITEFEKKQEFQCIIKNCDENINSINTLARHLVLKHYEQLESVPIYGKCPDCEKTFSNIIDFNKHSCCRNIKRKPGSPNYCQYCDMDFQSLKRYVFHMQFHLTHRRPKICLLCNDLFKISNDFFEHTQYQHIPETSMACIKCDRFFKKKEAFDNHMELHEDCKYQYSCTLCTKKYTNKSSLNQHMDVYHSNKSNVLRCSHCDKEFVNKISYRNHIKCHETGVQVESFICSTCGIITNNSEFIKYHIESDENSCCFSSPIEETTLGLGYTCENCSLDFHTVKQLKTHRLSESHSDDLFYCGICRLSFKSLVHMRNHSNNHKDFKEWQDAFPITRFFVCNIGDCQEFYPIWTSLYYHKRRPHKTVENSSSPNKFKCQFCQQLCSSKMSLAVHVARSHNNSNIKCTHCKRGLKTQKLLLQHIDHFHTAVECEICFKKFKNRRNLEAHNTMVHLNIKRYFCKHCEKGYFHKSERDIHEKKVHPEVAYKCGKCNFTTNYLESLEIHMDRHNNQLKFKCTTCGKEFGRKQLLKGHLKRHLDKKDYSCAKYLNEDGCDGIFTSYHVLKRHIQSKHPNSCYDFDMQKDEQHKAFNICPESDQMENISYEILKCDDGSMSETSHLNDTEFDRNAIELVLDNDVEFDEQ